MKRFKFLGALFVWLIWLVSFWYCWTLTLEWSVDKPNLTAWSELFHLTYRNSWWTKWSFNIVCRFPNHNWSSVQMDVVLSSEWNTYNWSYKFWNYFNVSSSSSTSYFDLLVKNNVATSSTYNFTYTCVITSSLIPEASCPECPVCEQYTSEECQQEYSLMPINSCNSEYCWLNWLCPEYTWSTMSELYINWINHLGAPIINISIPLEQAWDYEYTWDVMNINLSWENNVDYEYIDNIIKTQRSTPDDEDLNTIVSWLIPLFVPWLVLIVFIIFIFRFIKKVF